MSYVRWREFLR